MGQVKICMVATLAGLAATASAGTLVEAEAFAEKGGWVVDQQFMDQMGSPFLLAHGLGKPVAGRCLSATSEAAGAVRVMPPVMAMGQAAGTAAALCVRSGITPRRLDASVLAAHLSAQGAFLG